MKFVFFMFLATSFSSFAALENLNQAKSLIEMEDALCSSAMEIVGAVTANEVSQFRCEKKSNNERIQLSIYLPAASVQSLTSLSGIKSRNIKIILNEIYLSQQQRINSSARKKVLSVEFISLLAGE